MTDLFAVFTLSKKVNKSKNLQKQIKKLTREIIYMNYKLSAISTAISLALVMSPSLLHAKELDNKQEKEIEVISVTGFKGSLLRSLNEKRFRDGVSDSIFSEDIGKSADQDIGEALQRVTGVSITQGGGQGSGEGTNITVRGAGPNLNNISLNGVSLTSSGASQTVDLSSFSADILNSIVVSKTSSAEQDEGSLGASVELKTFRPLNGANKRALDVQGRYDDYAKDTDFKLSGSFSEKFLDETLGFYVTGYKESQSSRRDMYYVDAWSVLKAPNAIDSITGQAINPVDDEGNPGHIIGLFPSNNGTKLFQNSLEREGFTTALQWALSETTEINFNVSYSNQYREVDDNSALTINGTARNGAVRAEDYHHLIDSDNPWLIYDAASETYTKKVDRATRGRIQNITSGVENKNTVVNLDLSHYFTDDFSMEVRGGYSKTISDDDYWVDFSASARRNVNAALINAVDDNLIQPTGYDCSTGPCYLVAGTSNIDLGADLDDASDNVIFTAFNPNDIEAMKLGGARTRDRDISDEQKSLYVDFDWQVDMGPITSFEFGAKYQKRDKDVFNQQYNFSTGTTPDGYDEPVDLGAVAVADVTNGPTPYGDEFLADLGYDRTNSSSWSTIDARAALATIFHTPDPRFNPNLANDRQVSLENKAAYLKANFAFFDEDLTGNIGLRWVESGVESFGYSGFRYNLTNITDRALILIAADSSNPVCTAEQLASAAGGFDANGVWGAIADQSCYDENYNYDPDTRSRYLDGSLTENPEQFANSAYNKTENLLPSLNLNYNLNEDTIIRFAASKTMARPKIDSLKPSFNFSESVWGASVSKAAIDNPYLEPLESNNLDLSYEWYFNDGGAITVALFDKKMTNFEESQDRVAHWIDARYMTTEQRMALSQDDIILDRPVDSEGNPTSLAANSNCMVNRVHKWTNNDPEISKFCDDVRIVQIRNGLSATNRGIELAYNQNYDFLPGIWGGLGTSINYTYSDSDTDAEVAQDGTVLPSMPMANVSKHVYNISTFWQQNGHLIRLAYNHRSDSLAQRSYQSGSLWNQGSGQLDISANYKVNDNVSITFNAVNLNNRENRQYYTTTQRGTFVQEGNALEGKANKSRTVRAWTQGTIYRVGIRATF